MEAHMKRVLNTAVFAVLFSSTAVFAAQARSQFPPPSTDTNTPTVEQMSNGQRCASLHRQWMEAEQWRETSARLGQARSEANLAHNLCRSTDAGDVQKGIEAYRSALRLLGVNAN
jgi:hypothetical protein